MNIVVFFRTFFYHIIVKNNKLLKTIIPFLCLPLLSSNSAAPNMSIRPELIELDVLNIESSNFVGPSQITFKIQNTSDYLITSFAIDVKAEETVVTTLSFYDTIPPYSEYNTVYKSNLVFSETTTYSFEMWKVYGYKSDAYETMSITNKISYVASRKESLNEFEYYVQVVKFSITISVPEEKEYEKFIFYVNTDIDNYSYQKYPETGIYEEENQIEIRTSEKESEIKISAYAIKKDKNSSNSSSGTTVIALLCMLLPVVAYFTVAFVVALIGGKIRKNKRNRQ